MHCTNIELNSHHVRAFTNQNNRFLVDGRFDFEILRWDSLSKVHCLEDTGVTWCHSYLSARRWRSFSPEVPRARKPPGRILHSFHFFDLRRSQVDISPTCDDSIVINWWPQVCSSPSCSGRESAFRPLATSQLHRIAPTASCKKTWESVQKQKWEKWSLILGRV